ncbi:MAG: B12-binding domain-containing radical SAM protein [Lachnospiraceae bacterium]|nr:B12-binding domain-containing radical SAM protein [Lachnospiraceae bacterium]
MKIILIALPQKVDHVTFEAVEIAPLALYLLAAVLKKENHQVYVIDPCEFLQFQKNEKIDEACAAYVMERIREYEAEAVAFSVNSFNWSNSKIVVDMAEEEFPNLYIALGGLHATIFAEHVLEVSKAHVAMRGEGEKVIVNLCNALESGKELCKVKGIIYKMNGCIFSNEDEEPLTIEEMKNSPLPSYELLPENNPYTQMPVESSRGCYYSCAFCSIPHRHVWRGLDEIAVIERTKHALKYHNNIIRDSHVLYVDDCFTANRDRAINIFSRLGQLYGNSHKFFIEARITDIIRGNILQNIPSEMISSMQIGVECGYNEGLKRIHKGLTVEQLYEGLKLIKEYKFEHHCFLSFIIGFPWETMDMINQTLDTIERISSEYHVVCNLNWLLFLPSDLWKERKEYHIDLEEDVFDQVLWYGNSKFFFQSHPKICWEDILQVEERIRIMQMKGPVGYRRSIGLEEGYKEPSSAWV